MTKHGCDNTYNYRKAGCPTEVVALVDVIKQNNNLVFTDEDGGKKALSVSDMENLVTITRDGELSINTNISGSHYQLTGALTKVTLNDTSLFNGSVFAIVPSSNLELVLGDGTESEFSDGSTSTMLLSQQTVVINCLLRNNNEEKSAQNKLVYTFISKTDVNEIIVDLPKLFQTYYWNNQSVSTLPSDGSIEAPFKTWKEYKQFAKDSSLVSQVSLIAQDVGNYGALDYFENTFPDDNPNNYNGENLDVSIPNGTVNSINLIDAVSGIFLEKSSVIVRVCYGDIGCTRLSQISVSGFCGRNDIGTSPTGTTAPTRSNVTFSSGVHLGTQLNISEFDREDRSDDDAPCTISFAGVESGSFISLNIGEWLVPTIAAFLERTRGVLDTISPGVTVFGNIGGLSLPLAEASLHQKSSTMRLSYLDALALPVTKQTITLDIGTSRAFITEIEIIFRRERKAGTYVTVVKTIPEDDLTFEGTDVTLSFSITPEERQSLNDTLITNRTPIEVLYNITQVSRGKSDNRVLTYIFFTTLIPTLT